MASIYARHPLTKQNLTLHNRLLENQQHTADPITAWVDKVILEEQNHLFCSQMGLALSELHLHTGQDNANVRTSQGMERPNPGAQLASSTGPADGGHLKIFEQPPPQRSFMYLESPLERYLTPGSSDPSYFSRPTLAHMGIQFGSMEGRNERREMVRGHVNAVTEKTFQAQGTSSK